jgi:hypothetical protein
MAAATSHRLLVARRSAARALACNEAVAEALQRELGQIPPRPPLFDAALAWLAQGAPADAAAAPALRGLGNSRRALLGGAGDEPEPTRLWREGLATAWSAARLARELALDAKVTAAAGLMHRLGELRVLTALAVAEREAGIRIDAPSRAGLCAEHGGHAATRMFAAWSVHPRAASAAAAWRNAPAHGRPPGEAALVYVGHLLANRVLNPEFPAPGLAHAVKSDFGIGPELLDPAPAAAERLRLLLGQAG